MEIDFMSKQIYKQMEDGSFKLIDTPDNVNEFLKDYETICKKYNLSLAYQDIYDGFYITNFKEKNINWIKNLNLAYL